MDRRLTEFPDRRVWDLSSFTLDQICLDYRTTLLCVALDSSLTIIIGTSFIYRTGTRVEAMNPEHVLSVTLILPLLHMQVKSLTAFRSGLLLLVFEDDTSIEVHKDQQYESWETSGTGEVANIGMLCSGHNSSPWDKNMSRSQSA